MKLLPTIFFASALLGTGQISWADPPAPPPLQDDAYVTAPPSAPTPAPANPEDYQGPQADDAPVERATPHPELFEPTIYPSLEHPKKLWRWTFQLCADPPVNPEIDYTKILALKNQRGFEQVTYPANAYGSLFLLLDHYQDQAHKILRCRKTKACNDAVIQDASVKLKAFANLLLQSKEFRDLEDLKKLDIRNVDLSKNGPPKSLAALQEGVGTTAALLKALLSSPCKTRSLPTCDQRIGSPKSCVKNKN